LVYLLLGILLDPLHDLLDLRLVRLDLTCSDIMCWKEVEE
jgi:hypothetical protein